MRRIALFCLLALSACDAPKQPAKVCVREDMHVIFIPTLVGQTMIMQQVWVPVCNKYAPNPKYMSEK